MLIRYLMFICNEEIVGLEGRETSLASVLAVLNTLLSSVDCAHALIVEGASLLARVQLDVLCAQRGMVGPEGKNSWLLNLQF